MPIASPARLTPLQRSVLHVLGDGRRRDARQVFDDVEALIGPALDARAAGEVRLAICGALEGLVADGLAEHRGRTGYILGPGLPVTP